MMFPCVPVTVVLLQTVENLYGIKGNLIKKHLFAMEANSQKTTLFKRRFSSSVCVQAVTFSLCWVLLAGPDNTPWCVLCSAEPNTAVATHRTLRTEVNLFRCTPPPHLIASFLPDFPLRRTVGAGTAGMLTSGVGQWLHVALIKWIQRGGGFV